MKLLGQGPDMNLYQVLQADETDDRVADGIPKTRAGVEGLETDLLFPYST